MDNAPTPGCIDALIGPKARASGCRCWCAKCRERDQAQAIKPESKPTPIDGKMAAAHDREETDD